MKIRTKLRVNSIVQSVEGCELRASVVTSGSPENEQIFKYTPWGQLELGLLNPKTGGQFKPGMEFFVDLIVTDGEAERVSTESM